MLMTVDERTEEPPSNQRRAFTLLELLVVIAIITMLLTILAPGIRYARNATKQVTCADHLRALAQGWITYHMTNDGWIIGGSTYRSFDWVKFRVDGSGTWIGDPIKEGALYPYVNIAEVYKCTNPVFPSYPISYSICGIANGQNIEVLNDYWRERKQITRPSEALIFTEEDDYRGFNMGSWVIRPDAWADFVAGNHHGGDNNTFADGHVQYRKWQDPRTLTMDYYIYGPGWPAEDNVDHRWLWERYIDFDWSLPSW